MTIQEIHAAHERQIVAACTKREMGQPLTPEEYAMSRTSEELATLDAWAHEAGKYIGYECAEMISRKRAGRIYNEPRVVVAFALIRNNTENFRLLIRTYDPWFAFEEAVHTFARVDAHKDEGTPAWHYVRDVINGIYAGTGEHLPDC
jgi:hypothetical protein